MTSLQKRYEGKELGCHFPGSPLGFVKEMRPLTDPTGRSRWFSRRKPVFMRERERERERQTESICIIESMYTCVRKKGNERVKSRGIMNTCMSKTGRKRERGA